MVVPLFYMHKYSATITTASQMKLHGTDQLHPPLPPHLHLQLQHVLTLSGVAVAVAVAAVWVDCSVQSMQEQS